MPRPTTFDGEHEVARADVDLLGRRRAGQGEPRHLPLQVTDRFDGSEGCRRTTEEVVCRPCADEVPQPESKADGFIGTRSFVHYR